MKQMYNSLHHVWRTSYSVMVWAELTCREQASGKLWGSGASGTTAVWGWFCWFFCCGWVWSGLTRFPSAVTTTQRQRPSACFLPSHLARPHAQARVIRSEAASMHRVLVGTKQAQRAEATEVHCISTCRKFQLILKKTRSELCDEIQVEGRGSNTWVSLRGCRGVRLRTHIRAPLLAQLPLELDVCDDGGGVEGQHVLWRPAGLRVWNAAEETEEWG